MRQQSSPKARARLSQRDRRALALRPLVRAAIRAQDIAIESESKRVRRRASELSDRLVRRIVALGFPLVADGTGALVPCPQVIFSERVRAWAFGADENEHDDPTEWARESAGIRLGLIRVIWDLADEE